MSTQGIETDSDIDVVDKNDRGSDEIRDYFCKGCPVKVKAKNLPVNWYIVRKSVNVNEMPKTIALYHTTRCLIMHTLTEYYRITKNHATLLLNQLNSN